MRGRNSYPGKEWESLQSCIQSALTKTCSSAAGLVAPSEPGSLGADPPLRLRSLQGIPWGGAISVLAMAPGLAMCLEESALAFAQSTQVELSERGWSVKEGYTFGMPRAGDATFAVNFDHLSTPQCEESREG